MELILFDDAAARAWQPFALTRPAGELRLGARTFRERAEQFVGVRCRGHLAGAALAAFDEPGCAPGLDPAACADPVAEPRVFLSSRAVPASNARLGTPARSGLIRIGDRPAGWYVAPRDPPPDERFLASPDAFQPEPPTAGAADGWIVDHVWQLVTESPEQIRRDLAGEAAVPPNLPAGVHLLGDPRHLTVAPGATLEPGVVIDVTTGPVRIEDAVTLRAFTRLAGPAWIGAGSTLLGGPFEAVSIGPVCRVHGEVEDTVILGYANKAHDGFLGHAYVGRWVNLGALTTNSDLKNNYGPIRLWTERGEVDTGLTKLGCLIGDHVKTGIGVMLNTGTVVGAGSNLFGAEQPPKYVAPFSWGGGETFVTYRLDRFLEVAARVMARRGVALTPGVRAVLEAAWRARQVD